MPKAKSKTTKTPKSNPATKKGLTQEGKNFITIGMLVMFFFIPLFGFIGAVLMWIWTKWKLWIKILITIPLAFLLLSTILLMIYISAYRPFQMSGESMSPTYKSGTYLMTDIHNDTDQVKRGDVYIYRSPKDRKKDLIKRVIAVPGDTVMLDNGSVFVNNKKLDESDYLAPTMKTYAGAFLKEKQVVKIPEKKYFVLGDNREYSSDSRETGFVPEKDLISKVSFCYWNCE